MAINPGIVRVTEGSGKTLDCAEVTVNATVVEREIVSIGSPDASTPLRYVGVTAGGALQTDASATTQPVSGTVTANVGTTGGLALDTSLTTLDTDLKATQPRDVTDRSGRLLGHVTVDSAPTTAVTLPAGQAVELLDSGGTNKASISAGGALKVDGSAVTQPVSGTVTSNIGTTGGLALDASLTTLDTDLKATQPRSITNFPATQAVSVASLPLPANASQETGGNLATLVTQTRNDAQIIDVLQCILAQLKLLNFNFASNSPSSHTDLDTWMVDSLPILN